MQIYLVGGAVRDTLLKLPVHERDWLVTGAMPEEMLARGFSAVGKDFPVFLHPDTHEEYALARTERKSGHGYRGFTFHTSPDIPVTEDLQRRDLTINAMAQDEHGNLIDPFNGRGDLEKKILRHVSGAFAEDPLRVLRVARFAARFHHLGFRVAPETLTLMKQLVANGEVAHLVPERVWQEIRKSLGEKNPEVFIEVLRECGALAVLLPEIENLFGVPQRKDYHPEVDTGLHTLMSLHQAARLGSDGQVRFAALVHDLGKAETPAGILPRHIGHEKRSLPLIRQLCERLNIPNNYRDLALLAAEFHTHCHKSGELNASTVHKVLKACRAFQDPHRLEQFLLVCEADARGRTGWEDKPYPQSGRFRKALQACQGISAGALQAAGFEGQRLGRELEARQIAAIEELAPKTTLT
jgi:tRNA nucleotidyltransferase (CCA-adding enzyme)